MAYGATGKTPTTLDVVMAFTEAALAGLCGLGSAIGLIALIVIGFVWHNEPIIVAVLGGVVALFGLSVLGFAATRRSWEQALATKNLRTQHRAD